MYYCSRHNFLSLKTRYTNEIYFYCVMYLKEKVILAKLQLYNITI